jgi:DNA-directed RNA polymerase subunit M/transcription elongation factor TFIIS
MSKLLKFISRKKQNQKIISKYIKNNDEIYELAFQIKEDKKDLKDVFQLLKNSKLGLNHDNFYEISKRIEETDTFINKPFDVSEGVNECSKCKSKRTISYTKQMRSADEGQSVIVTCIDCKYRYIMNS